MRPARGRAVVVFDRNFDIEDVSDHLKTSLGRQIWVAVDTLAEPSARRRQLLRDGGIHPRESISRRSIGVVDAADSSQVMSEHVELGAGRARAPCAGAPGARSPTLSVCGIGSRLPGASRSRAPRFSSLGGLRCSIGTGLTVRLRSCTTGSDTRDSFVPIGSLLGG